MKYLLLLLLVGCAHLPSPRGECGIAAPIKGNADNRLYFEPGDRYYHLTVAERCFKTPRQAQAAGYYPHKSR